MSNENIFSTLAKYNSLIDENYLTEAFVFLINSLLTKERPIALEILTKLCVKNGDFSFGEDEHVSVSTQVATEQGRPDIKVSSPDKLIYIEVKDYSPVDVDQLKRYKKDLESSNADIRQLILLTRPPVDFSEHKGIPDKHVRWFEVYNWLANAKAQDPVSVYLIESFKSFLEVKQMSIQRVSWEYINGVPAFNNLINMIEVAIKGASLHVHQKSAGWGSKAFWLESKKYWCGVYHNAPLAVVFKAFNKEDLDTGKIGTPSYPVKKALKSIWFQLRLDDIHFFSLDKDEQLEEITKFVKTAYAEAQQMRKKEK